MATCTIEDILKDPSRSSHEPNWTKEFPTVGEGVINFNVQRSSPFWIVIRPKKRGQAMVDPTEWICLEVTLHPAAFKLYREKQLYQVTEPGVGYEKGRKISYWFSYDRQRLVLKYGKGYHMTQTTLLEYDFLEGLTKDEQEERKKELRKLFSPEFAKVIEQYDFQPHDNLAKTYRDKLVNGMTFGHDGELTVATIIADCSQDIKPSLEDEANATAKSIDRYGGQSRFV